MKKIVHKTKKVKDKIDGFIVFNSKNLRNNAADSRSARIKLLLEISLMGWTKPSQSVLSSMNSRPIQAKCPTIGTR